MSFAAPLIAISLVIAVIGAAIAVAPRARRTMFVATVGCATVALAALLAAQLRRVDSYFNDPGRLVWDNHPDTGFRALVIASLVATALVGLLTVAFSIGDRARQDHHRGPCLHPPRRFSSYPLGAHCPAPR